MAKNKKQTPKTEDTAPDKKADREQCFIAALSAPQADTDDGAQHTQKKDWWAYIPAFLKAFAVKWCFACIAFFAVNSALSSFAQERDIVLISGIVLGLLVYFAVNPLLFADASGRGYSAYIAFPFPTRAYWTAFANALYYALLSLAVSGCYSLINHYMFTLDTEVFSYGLIMLIVDMAVIGVKDGVVALRRLIKKAAQTTIDK